MCEMCEVKKRFTTLATDVLRLARKIDLARANFQDAAGDEDQTRMEERRLEIHTLIDALLDATAHATKESNEIQRLILKGYDESGS